MTHTLQAMAWTLIHFCWQGALIAGGYRLASAMLARRSSQTRYLAALMALLLMMASAAGTFAWEMRSGLAPAGSAEAGFAAAGDFPRSIAPGLGASGTAEQPGEKTVAPRHALPGALLQALPWIDGLWVLGVMALSLRTLGGWWVIERLRRSATAEAPAAVRASFARIAKRMGVERAALRVSSAIAGPVTVGFLRALVLLPMTAATQLSAEELVVVLAHELAHVRRADFLWNLLQALAETLFFFHPAVWWVSARIRYERELCCDDIALEYCANPLIYAHALYRLEEQRSRQMRLAMALNGHQHPRTLRMRVARILGEPVMCGETNPVRPRSLAAACAALAVLVLAVPQLMARLNPPAAQATTVKPVMAAGIVQAAKPSPAVPQVQAAPAANAGVASTSSEAQPAEQVNVAQANETDGDGQAEPAHPAGSSTGKGSYIDRMRAAGYDVDLDKLIAMKVQNITPEYAEAMSKLGFGKLSADDLIACKVQGVSPEVIAKFKQDGFEVKTVHDAISYRVFNLTPEYAAEMKAAGFDGLDASHLISMRAQGVTPEYARAIKAQYPNATAEDVLKTRIFHIDAAFIAAAKQHGFSNLSLDKLVQLRISGLLDDEK